MNVAPSVEGTPLLFSIRLRREPEHILHENVLSPYLTVFYIRLQFNIPRVNTTDFGKHSAIYLGLLLWSKLDAKVREQQCVGVFKKLIRKQNLAALFPANDYEKLRPVQFLNFFVIEYVYILLVFMI